MRPPILISVGEASGDRQAAALVRALGPDQPCLGKVGPELEAAGVEAVCRAEGAFGFSGLVGTVRALRQQRTALVEAAVERGVETAVLVDYSGFHLPLGKALRRRGIRVVGFIPPKLWAWGSWRLSSARKAYDELFVILPFEADWWRDQGVACHYVGNPIAEDCQPVPSQLTGPVALLPGSRRAELDYVGPLLKSCAQTMEEREPGLTFRIPVAPTLENEAVERCFQGLNYERVESVQEAVAGARVALVCNGTATLETALIGTPQVVVFRAPTVTWVIGRSLVRLEQTAPPNLVLAPGPWPEMFQRGAQPDAVAAVATQLATKDSPERIEQLDASVRLREAMAGGVGMKAVVRAVLGVPGH